MPNPPAAKAAMANPPSVPSGHIQSKLDPNVTFDPKTKKFYVNGTEFIQEVRGGRVTFTDGKTKASPGTVRKLKALRNQVGRDAQIAAETAAAAKTKPKPITAQPAKAAPAAPKAAAKAPVAPPGPTPKNPTIRSSKPPSTRVSHDPVNHAPIGSPVGSTKPPAVTAKPSSTPDPKVTSTFVDDDALLSSIKDPVAGPKSPSYSRVNHAPIGSPVDHAPVGSTPTTTASAKRPAPPAASPTASPTASPASTAVAAAGENAALDDALAGASKSKMPKFGGKLGAQFEKFSARRAAEKAASSEAGMLGKAKGVGGKLMRGMGPAFATNLINSANLGGEDSFLDNFLAGGGAGWTGAAMLAPEFTIPIAAATGLLNAATGGSVGDALGQVPMVGEFMGFSNPEGDATEQQLQQLTGMSSKDFQSKQAIAQQLVGMGVDPTVAMKTVFAGTKLAELQAQQEQQTAYPFDPGQMAQSISTAMQPWADQSRQSAAMFADAMKNIPGMSPDNQRMMSGWAPAYQATQNQWINSTGTAAALAPILESQDNWRKIYQDRYAMEQARGDGGGDLLSQFLPAQ